MTSTEEKVFPVDATNDQTRRVCENLTCLRPFLLGDYFDQDNGRGLMGTAGAHHVTGKKRSGPPSHRYVTFRSQA